MTDLLRKVEIIVEEKEDDGSEGEEECLPSRTWRATKKREEGVREKETDQQQQQQQEPESDVDVEDVIVAVDRPAAFSMSPPLPALHRSTTTTLEEMPIKSSSSETEEIQVGGGFRHSDCDDIILPALAKTNSAVRILEPSADALADDGELHPCPTCGRKFVQKTFDRHIKICEKVTTKKRKVFDGAKKRLEGLPDVPAIRKNDVSVKKKPAKPEDEFQKCPHCSRNFGPKAFDRHVQWCEEKSRRMQGSPVKDMVALAKLQARVAYRPKTPNRKDSGGSGTPLKSSFTNSLGETPASSTSMTSTDGGDVWTRSLSRDSSSRKNSNPTSGTRSLGRAGGISFLDSVEHTKETPDIQFIRAATGRGSIKRPAPTKSSVLRQQKAVVADEKVRAKTPNVPRRITSPVITSPRKAASPGFHLQSNGYNNNNNNNNYSYLIKPSAVRPGTKSSVGLRREPEGIEHVVVESDKFSDRGRSVSSTRGLEPMMTVGQYDHSQEYDPYQSAARQMQELLFGATPVTPPPHRQQATGAPSSANLRPSTNSAFQRYVPAPNVPSTADINSKFLSARSKLESYMTLPRRTSGDVMRSSWDGGMTSSRVQPTSSSNKSWNDSYVSPASTAPSAPTASLTTSSSRNSAKVAKFCHECGNPFALPDIRFCCECGVKRLYC